MMSSVMLHTLSLPLLAKTVARFHQLSDPGGEKVLGRLTPLLNPRGLRTSMSGCEDRIFVVAAGEAEGGAHIVGRASEGVESPGEHNGDEQQGVCRKI